MLKLGRDMSKLIEEEEKKMKAGKKAKGKEVKKPTPRKKQSWGFSKRGKVPSKGRKPTCKGCKKQIEYADDCIMHVWKKTGLKYPNSHKYHCRSECLKKLDKTHKQQFVSLAWNGDAQTKKVRDKLKKRLGK